MAIQNQYQAAYNIASGTTIVQASGNVTVHTLNFPKASAGILYIASGDSNTVYMTLPAATIGSLVLDVGFANGLAIRAVSADAFIVTYQTP